MRGALVLPGGGAFPTGFTTTDVKWGVQEWGFHTCTDDGRPIDYALSGKESGTLLDNIRTHGYKLRVTRGSNWPRADMSPEGLAKALSDDLTWLNQNGKQCSLALDMEMHDGGWILRALKAIRALRPGRGVFWTPEPHQGGWIAQWPELVQLINDDPMIFVVAQTYDKNMVPIFGNDGNRVDLWQAGIRRDKVEVYYGLRDKPAPDCWSGVLYDWNNFIA